MTLKNPAVVTIVGKSNSGKTTLLEKLIPHLKQRGYKIGSVKHAHDGFEMDREGKDSWRHQKAGANATLVISDNKIALVKEDNTDLISKMGSHLSDMDVIIAEGFKKQKLPKIEIFRTAGPHEQPLCMADENLVAFVTDSDYKPDVPLFDPEDIGGIADFIEANFLETPTKPEQ